MSWVFIGTIAILLVAIIVVELRAIRAGDEREHHAPGYSLVLGGLILIALGIAAAIGRSDGMALLASLAGLLVVLLGATRYHHMAIE